MAKSIRSKTKRFYRAKKREDSVYAAVHAARLNRLHRKLKEITLTDQEGDVDVEDVSQFADEGSQMKDTQTAEHSAPAEDAMELDSGAAGPSTETSKRISTHGPRNSRKEQWRKAKGLPARSKSKGALFPVTKRKMGRPQRRR